MLRLPTTATLVAVFLSASPWQVAAEPTVHAQATTRYGTLRTGPIAGHVIEWIHSASFRLSAETTADVRLPIVASIVDTFSCCDLGAANASAQLRWARRRGARVLSGTLTATMPTAFGGENLALALRLAERLEAARDGDAYRYQTLATEGRIGYGVALDSLHVGGELGARQRVQTGAMGTTETHATAGLGATTWLWPIALRASWRATIPIAGEDATLSHALAASAHRELGGLDLALEVLVPLDVDVLEQSAFVVGFSVARNL